MEYKMYNCGSKFRLDDITCNFPTSYMKKKQKNNQDQTSNAGNHLMSFLKWHRLKKHSIGCFGRITRCLEGSMTGAFCGQNWDISVLPFRIPVLPTKT